MIHPPARLSESLSESRLAEVIPTALASISTAATVNAVYSSSRIGVPLGINGTGRPLVSGIIAS